MIEKEITINSKTGLHARPAALFAQCASKFDSKVTILKDDVEVDGKSIMGLMLLAAGYNTRIRIKADGVDEKEAISALATLVESDFNSGK